MNMIKAKMGKLINNMKGFTLIELVIVIVIIGVLTSIGVPIYNAYVKRSMAGEGRALCTTVAEAEKAYIAEHTVALAVTTANSITTGSTNPLRVEPIANKYFTSYNVSITGQNFTVTTNGTGDASAISVTYVWTTNAPPTVTDGL